jgi:hypothetical protein
MADLGSLLGAAGIGGVIGKAIVSLELSTAKYQAELKAAQAETQAGSTRMGSALTSLGRVGGLAVAGLGVGLAAMAVEGISKFESLGAEVRTLEKQLGITAEQASVLRAQGAALGIETDKLSIGFGLFSKHLVAEDDPALEKYGITVERTADGQIDMQAEIAQVHALFERLGPGVERTAASMNLFGRSGKALLPLLSANSDELQKFADDAEHAGLIMSEDDVQAARELSIAQRELREAWEGAEIALARGLIPAITNLVEVLTALAPLLGKVGTAMQYLPLVQMSEDMDNTASGFVKFSDAVIDTIPILGHFVNLAGEMNDTVGQGGKGLGNFRGQSFQASLATEQFGKATKKAKDDIEDFTVALDENAEATKITRQEFVHATNVMQHEAERLNGAVKAISKEDWINRDYVKFLSEQGPEWLIGFADLTEKQQHKAQEAWEESTKKTDHANASLEAIVATLDHMAKNETKHKVIVEYEYIGFDPSKPGMTGRATPPGGW